MPTGHDRPASFGSRATRLSGAILVALAAAALVPAASRANHSVFGSWAPRLTARASSSRQRRSS